MKNPHQSINNRTLAAYAAPNFALAIMHMPVAYVIPALYAKHTTIGLATIGTILLFGRVFDAVTDPLIGFFSDRTRSRFGKRKPWMIVGTPFAMIAMIFLFSPPATASASYFLLWSVALFASWTFIDIPYAAWGAEMSRNYNERSRIMTWREIVGYIGLILFMTSPFFLFPWTGNTEIGPEVMTIAAWVAALCLPVLMFVAVKTVPDGKVVSTHRVELRDYWDSVRINKPLYRYLCTDIVGGIANGMWAATLLIFMDAHMGLGDKFIHLFLVAWITRLFVAPLWLRLIYRFGKHRVWAAGAFLSGLIAPMAILIAPGPQAIWFLFVYAFALGFTQTAMMVAPKALFGDIIDYDTLKTGSNKASSYYAMAGLVLKSISGVGAAIAFFFLSAYGFDVQGGNSSEQLMGLFLAFAAVPAVLYFLSGLIIWNFPLNARRQGIIQRRIESRADRLVSQET